jgi:hypothetical protein
MFDEFEDYDDIYDRKLSSAVAERPLYTLPELAVNQSWNCATCGSGKTIKPLHFNSVYQRIVNNQTGEVTENGQMMYVSPCCKGDLFIWDEHLEKEIEIDPKHFLKGSTS